MLIKLFRKHFPFSVLCCLSAVMCFPVRAAAGWILWEAPDYIAAPAGERAVRSSDIPLDYLPLKARLEGQPGAELELDAIFEAETADLRVFFGKAGFVETPYEFKKSFFGGLTLLFAAKAPSNFLPAPKWLAPTVPRTVPAGRHKPEEAGARSADSAGPSGARPQDLSFIRSQIGGGQGIYLWRLPYRTGKAPLWLAGQISRGCERGWAPGLGKAQKKRALTNRARRTGKTYFIFTLP